MKRILAWAGSVCLAIKSLATGILMPRDPDVPPLAIKNQRVDILLKEGVAHVKVEQTFKNSTERDLEAVYIFPLPENASIAEFALIIGGKRVRGELVEKEKARQVYQDIVRRLRDPGLLEHLSGSLFRVRVYPVPRNGEQKMELAYSQNLAFENGLYTFTYPLKTSEKASRTLEDFSVRARVFSRLPVKAIYSPSHKISVNRKGEGEAILGFEEDKSVLDRDFVVYYGVSEKAFGLHLLTHRRKGEDGFFMMLLAPPITPPRGTVIRRDVTFVLDTSGSMAGEKIHQAREALKYCLHRLHEEDRFNIIRFSTDVERFRDNLVAANGNHRKAATEFTDAIEARGGTDIHGALTTALSQKTDPARSHVVVFLTDGLPTVGVTDIATILEAVSRAATPNTRLFTFGVGHNVNTLLLDRIANEHGGVSQYVQPEENIEIKVSSFYDKISNPVLSRPTLRIEKIELLQTHPRELPDLFAGGQLTLFGRYRGEGHVAVRLSGTIHRQRQEYVFETDFPDENAENDFIPRLWATRRVGYLLEQMRLTTEGSELKEEIVRLGKEYGILTPYTSYLVVETPEDYRRHGIETPTSSHSRTVSHTDAKASAMQPVPLQQGVMHWAKEARWALADRKAAPIARPPEPAAAIPLFGGAGEAAAAAAPNILRTDPVLAQESLRRETGREAVTVSDAIARYKEAETVHGDIAPAVKAVGRRIFYLLHGVWTDREYRPDMRALRVRYASEEYFTLLAKHPELKACFALGDRVIVCLNGDTAVIVEPEM